MLCQQWTFVLHFKLNKISVSDNLPSSRYADIQHLLYTSESELVIMRANSSVQFEALKILEAASTNFHRPQFC